MKLTLLLLEILLINEFVTTASNVPELYVLSMFVISVVPAIVPINPDAYLTASICPMLYEFVKSVFVAFAIIPADSFVPYTLDLLIIFVSDEDDALATTPAVTAYVSYSVVI